MRGEHVFLRGIMESDFEPLFSWNFDSATTLFFPARWPNSEREQRNWFERQSCSPNKKKLIICELKTEQPIGLIGILNIDQVNKNCEMGITIGEASFRGGPYACEAVELVLRFLFLEQNFHLVYAKVMSGNDRAAAFFTKKGFEQTGRLREMEFRDGHFHDWLWLSLLRRDWQD